MKHLDIHLWLQEHDVIRVDSRFGYDGGGVDSWTQVTFTDSEGSTLCIPRWPTDILNVSFRPGQFGCIKSLDIEAKAIIAKRDENEELVVERAELLEKLAKINETIGDVPL